MSTLSYQWRDLLDPAKFSTVAAKGRAFTRFVYWAMNPCPNGAEGCKICQAQKQRQGYHPTRFEMVNIDLAETALVCGAFGKPNRLPHRWTEGVPVLKAKGVEYPLGEGWSLRGREIVWHDDAPVRDMERFGLKYRAYREDWVYAAHVRQDAFGGKSKAEHSLQLPFAEVEQGELGVSLYPGTAGYALRQGDRFIPVDAEMDFVSTIDLARGELQSRHRFVSEVVRAYALDKTGSVEVDVPGVTYDLKSQKFKLPATMPQGLGKNLVIQYRAAPIYTAYLDQGEFRHQGARDMPKAALLIREEIAR